MTSRKSKSDINRDAKSKYYQSPFNRYKQAVRQVVYRAVECGIIAKPDACEECGVVQDLEGHHEDYAKPLEIDWLCQKCHHSRHLKTHCLRGHEFTAENTYVRSDGYRVCRSCRCKHAQIHKIKRTQLAAAREILVSTND